MVLFSPQAAAHVWIRVGAAGVVIAGRREAKLQETAARLRRAADTSVGNSTRILPVQTDVTVSEEVERLFGEIKDVFGRAPDVVLACAGWVAPAAKMGEDPVENWWEIYVCCLCVMLHNAAPVGG